MVAYFKEFMLFLIGQEEQGKRYGGHDLIFRLLKEVMYLLLTCPCL